MKAVQVPEDVAQLFADQSVTIAQVGVTVELMCYSYADASKVFEWMDRVLCEGAVECDSFRSEDTTNET